jgi:hypothetical protein
MPLRVTWTSQRGLCSVSSRRGLAQVRGTWKIMKVRDVRDCAQLPGS